MGAVRLTLAEKLDPRRFSGMSPKMSAVVACVLGKDAVVTTHPALTHLSITSDGFVMAFHGEARGNGTDFIGEVTDFEDNWRRLIVAAELDEGDKRKLASLLSIAITDWRRLGRSYNPEGLFA